MARIEDIRLENYFGVTKKVMQVSYYMAFDTTDTIGLARYVDILVEDYGKVLWAGDDMILLLGAVINGVAYGDTTQILSITRNISQIPESITLHQNYPNPFNSSTNINFSLNQQEQISLVIYDVAGREVVKLISEEPFIPGTYSVQWNGKNRKGGDVKSGMYMYVLTSQNFTIAKKMLIMR